ncbi:hypothetical protein RhiJN_12988 [Ceratobasidium sp. AG-Ba]|nr:hypothetical protein RhiJN_12988 [Ceratobasidium sp. AG-Ba]
MRLHGRRQTDPSAPSQSSALSDAPPSQDAQRFDGPAGIRRPRDTPTAFFDDGGSDHARRRGSVAEQDADREEEQLDSQFDPSRPRQPGARSTMQRPPSPLPDTTALGLDRGLHDTEPSQDKGKNRARPMSPSALSAGSNDSVIPGHTASGMELPIAENVIANMRKGWVKHIAFTTLDDEYCEKVARGHTAGHTLGFNDQGGIQVLDVDVKDPSRDEHAMSFAQWDQAVPRFLSLVKQHLREKDHIRWSKHFAMIRKQATLHPDWELWLAYDIQMRTITRRDKTVDVTVLNRSVLEDLRPRFQVKTIQSQLLHSGLRMAHPPQPIGAGTDPQTWQAHQALAFGAARRVITHTSAQPRPRSLAAPSLSRAKEKAGPLMEKDSATSTMVPPGRVVHPHAPMHTSAPYAAAPTMEHRRAGADPRRVITPLLPLAWKDELSKLNLLQEFGDVPEGLIYGFRIGASHILSTSSTPPNHKSALDRPVVVREAIKKEVACGRYSGPFLREELELRIGCFRSAPLGVVEKSTPGEYRIIQDFSYPRSPGTHPSLNSEIDSDNFTCEWGFFDTVMDIVASAPVGAQAATFDVDAAYRRMPVFPEDQNHIVVSWEGKLYIDHCVPFGAASSNGIFGRCGDAIARIFTLRGMGPVVKWVDDFLFFRFPHESSSAPPYSEDDIYAIAVLLGWPWKLSKTRPFANIFIYLGFEWDIERRTVRITLEKRTKYIQRIKSWLDCTKVSLESTEKLVGTLVHCTQVSRDGRPHLAGLLSFLASFHRFLKNPFHLLSPSRRARSDVAWWLNHLSESPCSRQIRFPFPTHPIPCYMDASTSFGIGIIVEGHVAAWKLAPDWRTPGRDIGWAEMVAVELALTSLTSRGIHSRSVIFRSDNLGVVYAVQAGRSRNNEQNVVLMRILSLADKFDIDIAISYIPSAENPADKPSRGIVPSDTPHISWPSQTPPTLEPFWIVLFKPVFP